MFTNRRAVAALAMGLITNGSALAADVLYASDFTINRLVTLDANTGAVNDVGPLNVGSGFITDLTSANGHLYGIVSEYPVKTRLVEIDPSNAAILFDHVITIGGATAQNIMEALATTPSGELLVSIGGTGSGYSNSLAKVGLDGAISDMVNYDPLTDIDGLCADPRGGYIGLNREPGRGADYVNLDSIGYPSGTMSNIIQIDFSPSFNVVDDLVVLNDEIITLDAGSHMVHHHNHRTGVVTLSVPYSGGWNLYAGLAVISTAPPCPADLNHDGVVNAADLAMLLGAWNGRGPADLDGSGAVNAADLAILLGAWGPCG